ncbi:rhomboid protease GluP [Catenulispora sp. GP43]|uniref:rhomboid family intramembrane serine protease n=1 Tax=Catenulispora sp. GP43 TaxID=3156263 RepID=UPI0035128DE5
MAGAHELELYASAAVVIGAGQPLLIALSGARNEERSPVQVLSAIWRRRPWPWATAVVLAVVLVMIGLQYTVPGLSGHLMRQPDALRDGRWWRVFTALFIQSSGLVQIVVNVPALAVAGPVAERVLGPRRWLLVFFGSGVAANVVSEAGWSRTGGGCSVAICGLVGALAALCLVRAASPKRQRANATAILAAGVFLCAIANNHGVGLLAGCVLGLVVAWPRKGYDRVSEPVPQR